MQLGYENCKLCPRECGVDRNSSVGACGENSEMRCALARKFAFEEPPISFRNGSGAIFFSGCALNCCFCQNQEISRRGVGKTVGVERLCEICLELQDSGAENINLISPSHFLPSVVSSLEIVKSRLNIPVVYNTSGYEKAESLKMLSGLVDIYLPDCKYYSDKIAVEFSSAHRYFETFCLAFSEMLRQCGKVEMTAEGKMLGGVCVRHLVLPSCSSDSLEVLSQLEERFGHQDYLLSLMASFYPAGDAKNHPKLGRRLFSAEYSRVQNHAISIGFEGFSQQLSSAKEEYTPLFDLSGV